MSRNNCIARTIALLLGTHALAMVGACACSVPERPKSGVMKAEVAIASTLPDDAASVRYAVLWFDEEASRPVVSDEGSVRSTLFDVEFRLPPSVNVENLVPIESVEVARDDGLDRTAGGSYAPPASILTQAYRPRIVVYDDRDDDERLDLRPSREDSIDRVLAVDDRQGLARLLDVDGMLRAMTLPQTDRFYEQNPDFNGFAYVSEGGVQLLMTGASETSLTGASHQRNRQDLLCKRQVSNTSTSRPTIVSVDTGIDLGSICQGWVGECETASIDELGTSVIESTPEVSRTPQCKQNSQFESLIVFSAVTKCAECTCNAMTRSEVYIVRRTALPEWWPCGTEIGYCLQPGPLMFHSTLCSEVLDAGVPFVPDDAGPPVVDGSSLDAGAELDASLDGL